MTKRSIAHHSSNSLRHLWGYLLEKHGRLIRFIIVGLWNTLFGYVAFCGFDTVFVHLFPSRTAAYMLASVLSTIVSILNAYIFHKRITFESKAKGWAMIAEFFRFSTTYAITFCIGIISLPLLVEVYGFNPKIAAAIITLFCTIISYIGHLKLSFRIK